MRVLPMITLAMLLGACTPAPIVARLAPPPRPDEKVPRAPGPEYVWVRGHWQWRSNGTWRWRRGFHTRKPAKARRFIPGRWVRKGFHWRWLPGRWDYGKRRR